MRIGFIGGGTMAEAILSGVLDRELASAEDIAVAEVIEGRRDYLSDRYGVTVTDDGKAAAGHGSLVLLAVKPQDLPKAMSGLRKSLTDEQAALSIVAGATIKSIQKGLDHDGIVRIMPNTPAQIGAGVSVWTATEKTPPERVEETRELLQAIGKEVYVPSEKYVDMATGAERQRTGVRVPVHRGADGRRGAGGAVARHSGDACDADRARERAATAAERSAPGGAAERGDVAGRDDGGGAAVAREQPVPRGGHGSGGGCIREGRAAG